MSTSDKFLLKPAREINKILKQMEAGVNFVCCLGEALLSSKKKHLFARGNISPTRWPKSDCSVLEDQMDKTCSQRAEQNVASAKAWLQSLCRANEK